MRKADGEIEVEIQASASISLDADAANLGRVGRLAGGVELVNSIIERTMGLWIEAAADELTLDVGIPVVLDLVIGPAG